MTLIRIKCTKKINLKQKKPDLDLNLDSPWKKHIIINILFLYHHFLIYYIYYWYTVYPRSLDPFYIVSNYKKWVKTSWTYYNRLFVLDYKSNLCAYFCKWNNNICIFIYVQKVVTHFIVPCVQEVVTPLYIISYYIKWGNYFLDTQYDKLKKLFCSVDFNWFLREGGGQFDQMTLKTIIKKKTEKVIL